MRKREGEIKRICACLQRVKKSPHKLSAILCAWDTVSIVDDGLKSGYKVIDFAWMRFGDRPVNPIIIIYMDLSSYWNATTFSILEVAEYTS